MKKLALFVVEIFLLFIVSTHFALAVENPLVVPNNKVGIHILFPEEINLAATLVNSNGGDWGYVTIPIQAGDKNMLKWQTFMDSAKQKHVIPIVRLATEGDYFNTKVWRKPSAVDILDFANFLNSLSWPTKNKYIVVFNEVNRGDEWGGTPNPKEYADLLFYASTVFKNKDVGFFIISAGLDNAAPNIPGKFIDNYTFLTQMHNFLPNVFKNVDAIGSHSYPNPGFAKSPFNQGKTSIATFQYERALIKSYTGRDLPVFITETGWSQAALSQVIISQYFEQAFNSAWKDPSIVAVTPFLLEAGSEPFNIFSLVTNNQPNTIFITLQKLSKVKGEPIQSPLLLFPESTHSAKVLGERSFSTRQENPILASLPKSIKILAKWLLKM